VTRSTVARHLLAAQPERLGLHLLDANRRTTEILLTLDDQVAPIDEGWESSMKRDLERLRSDLATPTVAIHESVSPHPFGFCPLAMLLIITSLGFFGWLVRWRRWSRSEPASR